MPLVYWLKVTKLISGVNVGLWSLDQDVSDFSRKLPPSQVSPLRKQGSPPHRTSRPLRFDPSSRNRADDQPPKTLPRLASMRRCPGSVRPRCGSPNRATLIRASCPRREESMSTGRCHAWPPQRAGRAHQHLRSQLASTQPAEPAPTINRSCLSSTLPPVRATSCPYVDNARTGWHRFGPEKSSRSDIRQPDVRYCGLSFRLDDCRQEWRLTKRQR